MAIVTKKTALLGIAVVAGLLTLVKFMWKPLQSDQAMVPVDTTKSASDSKQIAPIVATPENTMMAPSSAMMAVRSSMIKTSYKNPGGSDEVAFTLSIDDKGIITEAKTDVLAVNPTSKMRQQAFSEALPAVLIGKDIKSLTQIDRVGGSSLTTGAFNAALEQLKAKL